jgi:hypothetical protein
VDLERDGQHSHHPGRFANQAPNGMTNLNATNLRSNVIGAEHSFQVGG